MKKSPLFILFLSVIFVLIGSLKISGDDLSIIHYKVVLAIFGMVLLPIFYIRFILKEPLSNFGFNLPKEKKSWGYSFIVFLFLLPPIFVFAKNPSFQKFYLFPQKSFIYFLYVGLFLSLCYYLAEEFLFRGFLFFNLWPKWRYHSFWVISLIFTVFHYSKLPLETLYSVWVSLVLLWLTLKTKSFLTAGLVHFLLAFILNILINYIYKVNFSPPSNFYF